MSVSPTDDDGDGDGENIQQANFQALCKSINGHCFMLQFL